MDERKRISKAMLIDNVVIYFLCTLEGFMRSVHELTQERIFDRGIPSNRLRSLDRVIFPPDTELGAKEPPE